MARATIFRTQFGTRELIFMKRLPIYCAVAATVAIVGSAFAAGHGGNPAVKARQSQMQLYQFNVGVLFGMAKGDIDYDAGAASAAAGNLAALSQLSQRGYWVPGTSSEDLPGETRALPALWADGSKAGEIGASLAEAAVALDAVAGDGKDAMTAALGPIGQACAACHKDYRQSQ